MLGNASLGRTWQAVIGFVLLAVLVFAGAAIAAEEPTLHQIYEAANSGKLAQAQDMMSQVLRDHPNSAKAHFVEAELLVQEGRVARAQEEFDTAQRLSPGLAFAKPEAVQTLQRRLSSARSQGAGSLPAVANISQASRGEPQVAAPIPWGMLLIGAGLIGALIVFVRSMRSRQEMLRGANAVPYAGGSGMSPHMFGSGAAPAGPAMGANMGAAMNMPQASGGIGSGIMGGLATGAALGAGMVAGEALMHHFTDGSRAEGHGGGGHDLASAPIPDPWSSTPDGVGDADFGVSDSGSWDDSGGGGDWS